MSKKRPLPKLIMELAQQWDMDRYWTPKIPFMHKRWLLLIVHADRRGSRLPPQEVNSMYGLTVYEPIDLSDAVIKEMTTPEYDKGYDKGYKDGYEDGKEDWQQ